MSEKLVSWPCGYTCISGVKDIRRLQYQTLISVRNADHIYDFLLYVRVIYCFFFSIIFSYFDSFLRIYVRIFISSFLMSPSFHLFDLYLFPFLSMPSFFLNVSFFRFSNFVWFESCNIFRLTARKTGLSVNLSQLRWH